MKDIRTLLFGLAVIAMWIFALSAYDNSRIIGLEEELESIKLSEFQARGNLEVCRVERVQAQEYLNAIMLDRLEIKVIKPNTINIFKQENK